MKNRLGREIPDSLSLPNREIKLFSGVQEIHEDIVKKSVKTRVANPKESKVIHDIRKAIEKSALKDGMTISFHHHFRNGDYVMNLIMAEIAEMGIKDLTVAASSIFPVQAPLVKHMESGTVTGVYAAYMSGPVAKAISEGKLKNPAIMHTHGGRSRAIECGDIKIDVAFIGAPTCDSMGNINGTEGKSACGSLGYANSDALYADKVIAVTDNLVAYPACPIEITQEYVDYVLVVDSIGDTKGIVSGTTQITKDPVGLKIAKDTIKVIEASGLLKEGMSFQTGAGGTSLAVASYLKDIMKEKRITGSFMSGGITGYLVDMLDEGLFKCIMDVQCFDLSAIDSLKRNKNHQIMSASMYGNPHNKGALVNTLDIVILGATEIDLNFNVNVTTDSNGYIMGGSGGHSDTAAGSKLSIVVSQLFKGRLPAVVDEVTTVSTPGETVDVLVTERGIAVNPLRQDLIDKLRKHNVTVMTIQELQEAAVKMIGKPEKIERSDKIVSVVEYRDGTIIDVVYQVKG